MKLMSIISILLPCLSYAASGVQPGLHCLNGVCVGEEVIQSKDCFYARVLAIAPDRSFVVQDEATGRISGGLARSELASTSGCGRSFCIGDWVYNRSASYLLASIVGVKSSGDRDHYALRFSDSGYLSCQWSSRDLISAEQLPSPAPGPEPTPFPPAPPVLSWECRLMTPTQPHPGYVGRGSTEVQAFANATNACLQFETPYQCRKNGRMECVQSP
jgi:hypothetical protein